MKRLGRAIEILAWALFFSAAALVLALRFWLLPDIERYRERIVAAVSAAVGQPVQIGGINAQWFGFNPRIHLRDVRLFDGAGREVLVLPSVENQLAWRSLLRGEIKVHALAIDDLRVQVRRDAEGALHVAGLKATGDARFARWVAAQDEIMLRNARIEWHDELRGAPPLVLSELHLRLRNSGASHAIAFAAVAPPALGARVDLRALIDGELLRPATWSGRVFADLAYTDLAAWRAWIDYPWEVSRGQGALRAWLTLDAGDVREATADLALADVSARFGAELLPLELASVQGRLQGAAVQGEHRIVARGFAAALEGGGAVAPSDFELSWSSGPDARGALLASAVELEPLARIALALPMPRKARTLLAEVKPRGRLAEASVEWRGELQAPASYAARGRFIDIAASAKGALPGFAGITGSFDADEQSARVVFATRKGEVELPRVFPQPRIPLDYLNGLVEWERRGDGYALRFSSLAFSNEHLSGSVHGTYASAANGPGSIDLAAQVNRADAAQIARYLPHPALMGGEATRAWLVRGVLAGRSSDVRVRLRGDLADFPFADPGRGQFSVAVRLERGVLHYADGWPRIEDIHGELVFEGEGMRFVGRSASVEGVAISRVEARIARLAAGELEVSGEAQGATADFLSFIRASPVRQRTGAFGEALKANGRGELRLKLALPLKAPAGFRFQGEYRFAGNDVVVHPRLPPIEDAAGKLAFTESTLNVGDVQGKLFGGPVVVNATTQPDGTAQVVAKGEATLLGTRPLFDHPWTRYLNGQAAYAATIQVTKGGQSHVTVRSALQGLTSLLPAPLAKRAAETLPLELELLPDERVKLKLGRFLAAELVRDRAVVSLNPAGEAPGVRLPERPGIFVAGSLAAVDLDKWLPLFALPGGGTPGAAFDVRVGALDLYGKRLHDVAARGRADAAAWSTTLSSREVAGELSYRGADGGLLVARLTRFSTPDDYPRAPARGALEPKDLPSMDLAAERFSLRGKDLGRVEIQGRRAGDDWRIDKLAMENAEAKLSGTGVWKSGMPSRSQLDFELTAEDAGLFLARVGYPAVVKDGKAELKGKLAWDGDPSLIDYASLSGTIELKAESGQFLEIEPGFGKLISLMSLQSLPKRIALDFRDVFSKGFDFERISSSGQVQGGVMTVKDFRMRGSSAQVEMSGEVDLSQETQNMRVRVVPSLGDSASTVIALVNPLLAIPAAIAQKILKDPLGHIFAFDYAVTGAWSDPKVAKLGVEAREAGPRDPNP
jgi:uncharacterized protein (TIGR02099 family)